eukprot:509619_1
MNGLKSSTNSAYTTNGFTKAAIREMSGKHGGTLLTLEDVHAKEMSDKALYDLIFFLFSHEQESILSAESSGRTEQIFLMTSNSMNPFTKHLSTGEFMSRVLLWFWSPEEMSANHPNQAMAREVLEELVIRRMHYMQLHAAAQIDDKEIQQALHIFLPQVKLIAQEQKIPWMGDGSQRFGKFISILLCVMKHSLDLTLSVSPRTRQHFMKEAWNQMVYRYAVMVNRFSENTFIGNNSLQLNNVISADKLSNSQSELLKNPEFWLNLIYGYYYAQIELKKLLSHVRITVIWRKIKKQFVLCLGSRAEDIKKIHSAFVELLSSDGLGDLNPNFAIYKQCLSGSATEVDHILKIFSEHPVLLGKKDGPNINISNMNNFMVSINGKKSFVFVVRKLSIANSIFDKIQKHVKEAKPNKDKKQKKLIPMKRKFVTEDDFQSNVFKKQRCSSL